MNESQTVEIRLRPGLAYHEMVERKRDTSEGIYYVPSFAVVESLHDWTEASLCDCSVRPDHYEFATKEADYALISAVFVETRTGSNLLNQPLVALIDEICAGENAILLKDVEIVKSEGRIDILVQAKDGIYWINTASHNWQTGVPYKTLRDVKADVESHPFCYVTYKGARV